MSRRQRKDRKRREKKLERVPEKLQRKRERRKRYRIRRMPGWIRNMLIVVLIAVIIVGAWILLPKQYPEPIPPETGDVHFIQQDHFYCSINTSNQLWIDYVETKFGAGTRLGEQPLHIVISREYEETERNFTIPDTFYYDYFGNVYTIVPDNTSNSIEYNIGGIYPSLQPDEERRFRGNPFGYWSLIFSYIINSSNDIHLAQDQLDDMMTFNFTISVENDTLLYNTPTIIHCNITINNLPETLPDGRPGILYSAGEGYLEIPKQVYNDTELLANITLAELYQNGPKVTTPPDPHVDNETLLAFKDDFTVFAANTSWGFVFDLNVTTFTNNSFNLIDFSLPQNEFWVQSGVRPGIVTDQRMHFPKATIDVKTPHEGIDMKNYTDIYFSFPQIWVNVSQPPAGPTASPPTSIIFLRPPSTNHIHHRRNSPNWFDLDSSPSNPKRNISNILPFESRLMAIKEALHFLGFQRPLPT